MNPISECYDQVSTDGVSFSCGLWYGLKQDCGVDRQPASDRDRLGPLDEGRDDAYQTLTLLNLGQF